MLEVQEGVALHRLVVIGGVSSVPSTFCPEVCPVSNVCLISSADRGPNWFASPITLSNRYKRRWYVARSPLYIDVMQTQKCDRVPEHLGSQDDEAYTITDPLRFHHFFTCMADQFAGSVSRVSRMPLLLG
jgi:hypothetical protein